MTKLIDPVDCAGMRGAQEQAQRDHASMFRSSSAEAMVQDTRFHHHPFLRIVAEEDVRFILEKDRSYNASWKEAGGRSAWHMLRRKMDRMINLMARPNWPESFSMQDLIGVADGTSGEATLTPELAEWLVQALVAEDVFEAIEAKPDGSDGTVLAEIRDLRRYLTLVEAEMMARGVVERPGLAARSGQNLTSLSIRSTGTGAFDLTVANTENLTNKPGTPEDGGHHARQDVYFWPWVIGWGMLSKITLEVHDIWNKVAQGVFVLEPRLTTELYSRIGQLLAFSDDITQLYSPVWEDPAPGRPMSYTAINPMDGTAPVAWWLRVDLVPGDERGRYRTLLEEQNQLEAKDLGEYVELYSWNMHKERYLLRVPAWRAEP